MAPLARLLAAALIVAAAARPEPAPERDLHDCVLLEMERKAMLPKKSRKLEQRFRDLDCPPDWPSSTRPKRKKKKGSDL